MRREMFHTSLKKIKQAACKIKRVEKNSDSEGLCDLFKLHQQLFFPLISHLYHLQDHCHHMFSRWRLDVSSKSWHVAEVENMTRQWASLLWIRRSKRECPYALWKTISCEEACRNPAGDSKKEHQKPRKKDHIPASTD